MQLFQYLAVSVLHRVISRTAVVDVLVARFGVRTQLWGADDFYTDMHIASRPFMV